MTLPPFFVAIATLLLLSQPAADWESLHFDGIEANKIDFDSETIRISVKDSATPMVRVLPETMQAAKLIVEGKIEGSLNLSDLEIWTSGHDDALLRVGLIEPGKKRLSALQRIAAPKWIRRLDELFSKTIAGVGSIRVFQLMPDPAAVGRTRTNPAAELFRETIAAAPENGAFAFEMDFSDTPIPTAGIWLLADGDDTNSEFTVTITRFELIAAP